MPCLLALLALEHLALDPAAPSPHTTVVQASVVIVLERASERWVQGHRSVGSGSVPRRLVLTNGVAAAVIITITDLFSQHDD
uniref:Secreted protein n=1 Tax=Oryza rufipogon TaxID=4529 RepID=A0A0E0QN93_ORYRU